VVLYASDRSLQDAQLGEDVAGFGAGDKIGAGVWFNLMLGKDVVKRCWTKILVKDVKRDCIV